MDALSDLANHTSFYPDLTKARRSSGIDCGR